ncbi:hypothetical protein Pmani_039756 [Petrolisthes manimaculis]|uniref:Uncharacterized protein n=1 Tax=Petrolisthes manimaculis TaxID=1843537 RepID=A0AAE1NDR9_9EUCA|nr:hypothetical protein Pmani_039756 [Petrolisthes manimaculis]
MKDNEVEVEERMEERKKRETITKFGEEWEVRGKEEWEVRGKEEWEVRGKEEWEVRGKECEGEGDNRKVGR